jgi:large subunit ribosomal protein L29
MKLREIKKQLADFRGMDAGRLKDELAKLKKEQFNLRFQQATGQLEKTSRMAVVRDQIARVQTVLREKQPTTEV